MASGGPKPPNLTRYRDVTYRSLVLAADPEFLTDSNRVVEYEVSSRAQSSNKRYFYGWYKSRGSYAGGAVQPGPTQELGFDSAFVNAETFFTSEVALVIPADEIILNAIFTDDDIFFTALVLNSPVIEPQFYDDADTFFDFTNTLGVTPDDNFANANVFFTALLTGVGIANRFENINVFFAPVVSRGAVTLTPARLDNTQAFYAPLVLRGQVLAASAVFSDADTFYAAVVTGTLPVQNYWSRQYFSFHYFPSQYFGPRSTVPDIPPGPGDYLANQYFASSYFK